MSRNYQPNTVTEGRRECVQNIHRGVDPLHPLFVDALRLIKLVDLGSKHGENGTGRAAGLQAGG